MKKISANTVSISLFILLIIIGSLQSCSNKNEDPVKNEAEDIKVFMENTQAKIEAPGWIAGVKTSTNLFEIAGGKANIADGTDITVVDLIRIGSITKTFTATLVLVLCDEGTLHLNTTLADYYPGFPNSEEITIRMLLKHNSGIVTWDENDTIRNQIYNGTGDWTIDKLINWAEQQPLISSPGTEFHYSNIGYFLLGKIVEQSTGSQVHSLIEERLCQPLNLNNTFMATSPNPAGETIHGYDGSSGSVVDMTGTQQADAINYELAWTSGGMLSTAEELAVWIRAIASGELLSDSLHDQQMPVLSPPNEHNPYWSGYGMGISQTDVWIGHTGAICGYVCNMSYNYEDDVSVVTFFNKFSAFDIDENTKDITAVADNFMELARYLCPESLQP